MAEMVEPEQGVDLTQMRCVPCEGGTPPMPLDRAQQLLV